MFAGGLAGGQLSVTVQLRARNEALPLPAAAMLISAWTDLEVTGESMDYNEGNDALFSKQWIKDMAVALLNGCDPRDPDASPLQPTARLGPCASGGRSELLLDDSRVAEHAEHAGIDVQLHEFPGQQPSFQIAAGLAPEADDAISRLAAWARPELLGSAQENNRPRGRAGGRRPRCCRQYPS